MGSIEDERTQTGILRFGVPDDSIGADERSYFAFAANKEIKLVETELHDIRQDPDIAPGAAGLDAQGFTVVNHHSALADSDDWFEGLNIEKVYFPEVEDLLCKLTGAKTAVINNCAFRRRLADEQDAQEGEYVARRNGVLDREIAKFPRDVALVYGKEEAGALEPARVAHIDYSNKGLRATARSCRKDIVKLAQKALDAEDAAARGENVKIPRYAAYTVWRPVRTVRRDPLAVCDARTVDPSTEYEWHSYRALSDVNDNGEYYLESTAVLPPKQSSRQKWYWVPEQTPDEVLIVKFADTAHDEDPNIAQGCPHLSPIIPGTENNEARCSIECRVLAFWE